MPADELYPDNFRDVEKALVMQDLINIFPALLAKLLISSELPGLLVFILEFLQPQFYASNTGCIKTFFY